LDPVEKRNRLSERDRLCARTGNCGTTWASPRSAAVTSAGVQQPRRHHSFGARRVAHRENCGVRYQDDYPLNLRERCGPPRLRRHSRAERQHGSAASKSSVGPGRPLGDDYRPRKSSLYMFHMPVSNHWPHTRSDESQSDAFPLTSNPDLSVGRSSPVYPIPKPTARPCRRSPASGHLQPVPAC